mgnify:CR=1 FL=1
MQEKKDKAKKAFLREKRKLEKEIAKIEIKLTKDAKALSGRGATTEIVSRQSAKLVSDANYKIDLIKLKIKKLEAKYSNKI